MSGPGFVHLHLHSSYSLLQGALSIGAIQKLATADSMPAVALTDTNNLFGALEFSEKLAGAGIQPIVGIELTIDFGDRPPSRNRPNAGEDGRGQVVLLAATEEGYGNLMALSSRAYLGVPAGEGAHLPVLALEGRGAGLILLSGGRVGPVDRALNAGLPDLARARMETLAGFFPGAAYVEIQRHDLADERRNESAVVAIAERLALPLVATNDVHFGAAGDFEAHDCLLAIAEGRMVEDDDRRRLAPEFRFASRAEMQARFADLPDALANTVEIARRCRFRPRTRKPILPRFVPGGDVRAEAELLRDQAFAGLAARLALHGPAPGLSAAQYEERLAFELSIIERMQYPGYFLIVADFIRWAKAQDIPVGPGRGSGAGSLVAYALTITDIDPLRFGLLFERFLNPERVSMPDFDIDFCQERRDEVIAYVRARYGNDRVAQIITFGTLLARGVMRDVGRVMGLRYGEVDRLTKLVPQNPAKPISLKQAIEEEPQLRRAAEENETVGRMLAVAQKLEGLYRHASTHAAGIVIGDRALDALVPLYRDPRSDMPVTQFNMKWVEPAGLVKFDFLGLKTLSVLQGAVRLIRDSGVPFTLATIPLDDARAYALMSRGETVGVFQVESGGMRRALVEMKPDRLEDIIALVALYRPGPMANIPVYCDVKHGRQEPDYYHPKLEPVLRETFGVIVYQEQVMQIAQILSGYSLGEADLLRRAMGKKIKAEMDAQRDRFVSGAVERGEKAADANMIFDLLAKFADYGFNKSHAAAYALIAYQTAYLKANFPVEFLAASMNQELSNTEKLAEFRREAQRLGIDVLPPDVSRSEVRFTVENGAIRFALGAVKGVGMEAARSLVAARGARMLHTLDEVVDLLDPGVLNKRCFEALVAAGAFDSVGLERAQLIGGLDRIFAEAGARRAGAASGQSALFDGPAGGQGLQLAAAEPWTTAERLRREYETIGFFLSGHPLDVYADVLAERKIGTLPQLVQDVRQGATHGRLAVTVLTRAERRTKSGNKIGVLALSDREGQFEAVVFPELLATSRSLFEPGTALLVKVQASLEADDLRVRVLEAQPLAALARRKPARGLRLFVRPAEVETVVRLLRPGGNDVALTMMLEDGGEVDVALAGRFDCSGATAQALRAAPGVVAVQPLG